MTAPLPPFRRLPPYGALHVPIRFTKAVLDAHGLLGVLFGWALYLVCFSGTLAVLADEFVRWEQPAPPRIEAASPALIARVAEAGYARAQREGAVGAFAVTAPSASLPMLTVSAGTGAGAREWAADGNARLTPRPPARWTTFLRQHHYDFNLPAPYGDDLVGVLGMLLIAALVSGTLAHRRILKDAFRLRWGGSRRLSNADLHNRIGIWALPFHLIVSLTGSLLGLFGLIVTLFAVATTQGDAGRASASLFGERPPADARPAPFPDIRPMLADIARRAPGDRAWLIIVAQPGTRGQLVDIYSTAPGYLTRAEGWTYAPGGRLIHKAGYTDGTIGMRLYGMVTPLHYGTYGGLPLRIAYVLLGASLTTLLSSGLAIWLARRREQGHAAPRRERLWVALVWGQPLAFALSALLTIAAGWAPLPLFWGITAAAALLSLPGWRRETLWRAMRQATGAAVLLLGLVHIGLHGAGAGLAIDLVLLALGGWTLAGLPRALSAVKTAAA